MTVESSRAPGEAGSEIETIKLTVTLPPGADGANARARLRFHAANRQIARITAE